MRAPTCGLMLPTHAYLCHVPNKMHLPPSSIPSSASAQLVHISYTMCKMILTRFTQGKISRGFWMWVFETIIWVYVLNSTAGSTDQQTDLLAALYNRSQRHNASTSQDADSAMIMHNVCKESIKHHQGTLWNGEGRSALGHIPSTWVATRAKIHRHTILSSRRDVLGFGGALHIIERVYLGLGWKFESVWLHVLVLEVLVFQMCACNDIVHVTSVPVTSIYCI